MSENFVVEIISPDRSILKENTLEVTIPSYEGEMGIMKDHIPLITFLRPGIIKVIGENEKKFFLSDIITKDFQSSLFESVEKIETFKGNLGDSDICFLSKK